MAASIGRSCAASLRVLLHKEMKINHQQVRYGFRRISRGKQPGEARTYAERIKELEAKDEINIGLPLPGDKKLTRRKQRELMAATLQLMNEGNASEKVLDSINNFWIGKRWSQDVKVICEHYGIYSDLFKEGYFYPIFPLTVAYDYDNDYVIPVYRGNILEPSEVLTKPTISYSGDEDKFYTLVMSAPDSHLQENEKEYLHYFLGNIPGNDVSKGEELCNYLQPFPVKGSGFHRYVFILYEHSGRIDFSSEKRPENCTSLRDRTFSSREFYKNYEDRITPASVAFFQCEWDESVRNTFWDVLDMQEPIFEFMTPPPYHRRQVVHPHKQPFNLYLDRYRDKKDIQEEVIKEKLKNSSPFQPKPPPPKYPAIGYNTEAKYPSWLRLKNKHKRRRDMHWVDMD